MNDINIEDYVDQQILGYIISMVLILIGTVIVARIFNSVFSRILNSKRVIVRNDATKFKFLRHFFTAIIYVIGVGCAIYVIPSLRSVSVSLFTGAGILAAIVGFASQQMFSDLISGIFIVFSKPFKVHDKLHIGDGMRGLVEDITLRHTVIRDFQNRRVIIPNSRMTNEVIINEHILDEKIRKWVEIGISYDSDMDHAMRIMKEEASKHPYFIDNRTEQEKAENAPEVVVRVVGFDDYAVTLRAYVWADEPSKAFDMGCDLNKSIKERFDKEGVEIPVPYRKIIYRDKSE